MVVSVAEYLGQRTDVDTPAIIPVAPKSGAPCPFMDRHCDKVAKGGQPVCTVRKADSSIWIVCEHRLCATRNKKKTTSPSNPSKKIDISIGLNDYQVNTLWEIAKVIYRGEFSKSEIGIKREVNIPLAEAGVSYKADYVMRNFTEGTKVDEILLEMQGGGETSSTGAITRHLSTWAKQAPPTNAFLRMPVKANTIETNAWRRQQEQFLVKGNVVNQTGGKLVFAVGNALYDYLERRFKSASFRDLRDYNWTLCILAFVEDTSSPPTSGHIPLKIDENRLLFTNYGTFVRFLTDQGGPNPEMFDGEFIMLDGNKKTIV
ncbi:hypothetical protein [Terasakiella pusilla]|uniref:hypothetical protein n=1 Tax=Terasakiella pusilla TaxID=64973 RepID=UPI003AA7E696